MKGIIKERVFEWKPFLILVLAAWLLLFDLGGRSLWWDEIINVYIERQPIQSILASLNNTPGFPQDIHPPAYHFLMHFWLGLVGTSDLAMRLPSALLAILSVALVFALGQRMHSRRLGLVSALLLAVSPAALMYFRIARYYALTCALGLLATWLFLRLWTESGRRLWVAYGLVALVLCYTDYLAVAVLGTHMLFAIYQGWRQRTETVLRLFALQFAVAIGFVPWLPYLAAQVGWAGHITEADLAFSLPGYVLKVLFPFFSFTSGETLFPWEPPALIGYLVMGSLLVVGAVRSQLKADQRVLLTLLVLLSLLGTILVISVMMPTIPFIGVPNRALFALPYLYLLMGSGWVALPRRWLRVVALAAIGFAVIWANVNYFRGVNFFNPVYAVPAEELVDLVLDSREPGDVAFSEEDIGFAYYLDTRTHDLPHYWAYSPEAEEIIVRAGAPRIWLLQFGRDRTRNDAASKAYRDLLAANGYGLVRQKGFVPQDPTYRWVKSRLLGREAYDYKVTVELYAQGRR